MCMNRSCVSFLGHKSVEILPFYWSSNRYSTNIKMQVLQTQSLEAVRVLHFLVALSECQIASFSFLWVMASFSQFLLWCNESWSTLIFQDFPPSQKWFWWLQSGIPTSHHEEQWNNLLCFPWNFHENKHGFCVTFIGPDISTKSTTIVIIHWWKRMNDLLTL